MPGAFKQNSDSGPGFLLSAFVESFFQAFWWLHPLPAPPHLVPPHPVPHLSAESGDFRGGEAYKHTFCL